MEQNVVRFGNPIQSKDEKVFDSRDGPVEGSHEDNAGAVNKARMKLKKIRSVDGSGDVENDMVPTPDRNVTEEQLRTAFEKIDTDSSGELDKEDVRLAALEVGAVWSDAQLQHAVNLMDDDGNANGWVDFEEFASFWLGKGWEEGRNGDSGGARDSVADTVGPCTKLGQILRKEVASMQGGDTKKEKQVEPESVFVMSAEAAASLDRERAELMDKIQQIYENDFHQLEDLLNTHAESRMEAEVWESCARDSFSEEQIIKQLGWTQNRCETAKTALKAAIEEETKGTINAGGGFGKGRALAVCWRCFLKDALAYTVSAVGTEMQRQSSWDAQEKGMVVKSEDSTTEAARAFIKASHGELEAILDDEAMPIDTAVEALIASLTEELRSRDNRIQSLVSRQSELADNTPRKIMISGLQGDSAVANGTYCADGLRACWGRPVYLQQVDKASDKEPYFLYYDQSYVKDDTTGIAQWSDGTWVIGPSQNSDRCTAYMPEVFHDGVVEKLLHPCCNVWAHWMVYDVVKKKWLRGPGDHCPRLSIAEVANDTYQDYIGKSIADQREMREMISRQVESSGFAARILRKLSTYLRKQQNGIQRKSYMKLVRKLHAKELRKMQSTIISNILAAHDDKRLTLPGRNDFTENYLFVETIVHKFVNSVETKQKQRVAQKRQFLAKMSRPAMTKAFYSWKMISRSSKLNKDVASNMFAEPDTPWNVRHPRSKFTNIWEGCQAFLLVYVAFSVTYRLCFNIEVDGFALVFDILVDMYFILDVIFNFHTAYYDGSGDLAGVKDGPDGQHVADLPAMYMNYMKGWAPIDLFSVMPTILILFMPKSEEAGEQVSPSQTKALKAIRLIRLAKLLRLVRAARLFKKYEEHFGPFLSLFMIFGFLGLVLHTITCVWFVIGTMPGYALAALEDRSVGWLQFVYKFEYCNCYDNATTFSQFFPEKNFDPRFELYNPPADSRFRTEGLYFDPYDQKCHALDGEEKTPPIVPQPICDPSVRLPEIGDYYIKSLFTVVRDPQISDRYKLSAREMMFAIGTTVILGSCWGILAGTFSTIFASNQLASQAYKMRIKQLKEFCRIKELPHGLCEKLEAHYYHLYPDKMMIDEEDVIGDLPTQLREELVGTMYGRQLYSIPLFLELDIQILTELCTKLVPLPALKGAIIAREGVKGTHMYCISTGQIKISEKIKDGDDAGRLRHWIEDVYSHANRDIKLFKLSMDQQIDTLLARIGRIAREKASTADGPSLSTPTSPKPTQQVALNADSDSDEDDDVDELQQRLRAAAQSASLGVVHFKDLLYDDELVEFCRENSKTVRQLVTDAGVSGRIECDGSLELTKADPNGPIVNVVGEVIDVGDSTSVEQLCYALQDGEVLLDLIKLLVPRLAQSDRTKKTTVERNLQNFFETITDIDGPFKIPPELVFVPDDLLLYDQGPSVMQHERQRRVVSCVLEMGFVATHMEGYMGPRLDDQTLGTLGPTEFFGELSLLPIDGGWSHRRTAMVVQNSMLHSLSSLDVQSVSDRFPELRHRLVDHAEDYQRVQAAAAAAADIENLSAIKAKKVRTGRIAVTEQQDPLAIVKAQLSQQDAKLEQLSGAVNLETTQAAFLVLVRVLDKLCALVPVAAQMQSMMDLLTGTKT